MNQFKILLQVVKGGNLDVDVIVEDPDQIAIYKRNHEEYDTFRFETNVRLPTTQYIISVVYN